MLIGRNNNALMQASLMWLAKCFFKGKVRMIGILTKSCERQSHTKAKNAFYDKKSYLLSAKGKKMRQAIKKRSADYGRDLEKLTICAIRAQTIST